VKIAAFSELKIQNYWIKIAQKFKKVTRNCGN
jgi:hypothetical protein